MPVRAIRLAAAFCLLALPAAAKPNVKKLTKELAEAKSVEQMISVVQALGRTRKPEAVQPLARLLDVRRNSPRLSLAVVRALGALKSPDGEAPLTGAWDYLNSVRLQMGEEMPANLLVLRQAVTEALGEVGTERAGEILLEALNDKDPVVVEKAARSLGRMRNKAATEPLIELLSRGGAVGQAAFEGLADLQDSRARAPLERALRHEDFFIQAQAAYALARLQKKSPAVDDLERIVASERTEAGAKSLAAYYLVRLDRQMGLDHLQKELLKGPTTRRSLAADMLGKSGNPRASQPLLEGLRSPDASLREVSIRGLGRLGGHRVVHALERMKDDPNVSVRSAAKNALADLGEE